MTVYCAKCGAANEDFAEFCSSCGEVTANAREVKEKAEADYAQQQTNQEKKLYRSRKNKILTGLSAGLAKHYGLDVDIVRILWVVAMLVSGGIVVLVYFIMALVVPLEPVNDTSTDNKIN